MMKNFMYPLLLLGPICCASGQVAETHQAPFKVTIAAIEPQYKLGEPAMIRIILKSLSQQPIDVPEERHVGRGEMNYRITVTKLDGSPLPDSALMQKRKGGHAAGQHSVIERELKDGDEIAEDADLNSVAKIVAPGDYKVQVERADYRWGNLHIRSNSIVVRIAP